MSQNNSDNGHIQATVEDDQVMFDGFALVHEINRQSEAYGGITYLVEESGIVTHMHAKPGKYAESVESVADNHN